MRSKVGQEIVPSVRSSLLRPTLQRKIMERRTPVSGSFELTLRCNLRCVHCYCAHGLRERELELWEIERILDQMKEAGTLWLLLTGGEPMLRPDFADIYRAARERGIIITLFTSGTLIERRALDLLDAMPPYLVEISLYGITTETYERVTKVGGSFERCVQGILALREARVPLRLKSPIMTINRHEFSDVKRFVEEDLGLEFRYDPIITAGADGSRGPLAWRLSPEEVAEIYRKDPETAAAWTELASEKPPEIDPMRVFNCGAGSNAFHIDPYGNLLPCIMTRKLGQNLREMSFEEAWYRRIPEATAQRHERRLETHSCRNQALCDRCPGHSEWENGNHDGAVDYLCRVSDARLKAFSTKKGTKKPLLAIGGKRRRPQAHP